MYLVLYRQYLLSIVYIKLGTCTCISLSLSYTVVYLQVHNTSGQEGLVPAVCFLIPPPDPEAIDYVKRYVK